MTGCRIGKVTLKPSNVIPFIGETRLNLNADAMLLHTFGKLTDVVIMGYTHDGEEWFASSVADGADVVWLLERAKKQLLAQFD